ncbi:MAG: hypothetical protein EOP04_11355 [Proteobacteria bacterium]|nr:MAG: hypothetical protein EOP04_11355 [Pseudomonadota bacterium]
MMKTSIFTHTLLAVAVITASASAHAEDRLTLQQWSQEFTASLKSKNTSATQKLIDFGSLSKKVLAKSDDVQNKELMTKARKLYAKGNYDEARAAYSEVSKSSGYWLQAIEEKAWTYFRQDQFDNTLAQTKTLMSTQFAEYVNPEGYLLQALTQLKTCDYKDLFSTNLKFKEKQKARLIEIQNLGETGMNEAFKNVIISTNAFPMKFKDAGANVNHLPQLFYKDIELQSNLMKYKLSERALTILASDNVSAPQILQASLQKSKNDAAAGLKARIKKLAQNETEDNFKVVQKINLVEVEAIQRLHVDVDLDKSLFKKDKFKDTTVDQLVFVDDGRPWIDELDKYEVRAKACPQNIRRKM